jgi:hypothetical protein
MGEPPVGSFFPPPLLSLSQESRPCRYCQFAQVLDKTEETGGEKYTIPPPTRGGRDLLYTAFLSASARKRKRAALTYKAYIDNIREKTGKGPEDFLKEAREKGLIKYGELLKWLKGDCGLGHGHANAMILYIQDPELAKKKILEDSKEEEKKKKKKTKATQKKKRT